MKKIRRATLKDVPRMMAIERATMRPVGWGKRGFIDFLSGDKWNGRLVRIDGKATVGFVLFCGQQILLLAVDPANQRQGHGAALMAEAFVRIRNIGWDKVELHVREGNEGARAFYRTLGFKRAGTFGTYGNGEKRIVMKASI